MRKCDCENDSLGLLGLKYYHAGEADGYQYNAPRYAVAG